MHSSAHALECVCARFHDHREIDIRTEGVLDGSDIGRIAVAGNLWAVHDASTEIARNITSVADAAKGTTAGATETAAAAAELARLASDLRRVVDLFKLLDAKPGGPGNGPNASPRR